MPDVRLTGYNTLAVKSADGVYRLKGSTMGSAAINILNLGPGTIFICTPQDPVINGPNSQMLPAGWAQNGLAFDGNVGLGVIADADATVTINLSVRIV